MPTEACPLPWEPPSRLATARASRRRNPPAALPNPPLRLRPRLGTDAGLPSGAGASTSSLRLCPSSQHSDEGKGWRDKDEERSERHSRTTAIERQCTLTAQKVLLASVTNVADEVSGVTLVESRERAALVGHWRASPNTAPVWPSTLFRGSPRGAAPSGCSPLGPYGSDASPARHDLRARHATAAGPQVTATRACGSAAMPNATTARQSGRSTSIRSRRRECRRQHQVSIERLTP